MVNQQFGELPEYTPYYADRSMEDIATPYHDIVEGFQSSMANICREFESTLAEATEAMKELLKDIDDIDVDELADQIQAGASEDKNKDVVKPATALNRGQSHSLRVFDK